MQEDLKYRDSDAVGALDRIERKYQDADKNWLEMTNLAEGIEVERDRYREALEDASAALARLRQEMEELRHGVEKHVEGITGHLEDPWLRIASLEAKVERLRKEASEALWWMEHANEPDDDNQTKEQYRVIIIDRLGQALKEDQ
jgi:chromosome segregation ATPase